MIGASPAIIRIRDYIQRLARGATNVLVTGETGTGKELVAQMLHVQSNRATDAFVSINCPAVPESLFESELFGHSRGAFTGADADVEGQLRAADGGTVFFDEIGELSLSLQAKLLRVIENKEFHRLGARRASALQAQVVAATNQDLEQMVADGKFRKDLFYRLNVARITVPPLRERREDIDALVDHFVHQYSRSFGRAATCSREVVALLNSYAWPGNVRELRNVLEAAFVVLEAPVIELSHLPPDFLERVGAQPRHEDRDRHRVLEALRACNGNKSRAAASLRCSRMTLYRRLARYGLCDGVGS